jgi:hypothetical protein
MAPSPTFPGARHYRLADPIRWISFGEFILFCSGWRERTITPALSVAVRLGLLYRPIGYAIFSGLRERRLKNSAILKSRRDTCASMAVTHESRRASLQWYPTNREQCFRSAVRLLVGLRVPTGSALPRTRAAFSEGSASWRSDSNYASRPSPDRRTRHPDRARTCPALRSARTGPS